MCSILFSHPSTSAHTPSVPIRHPSDKSSVVTSFETDIYAWQIHQDTRYIHSYKLIMRAASGFFSWSMATGLLTFSSRQFALTVMDCPLHFFFLIFLPWASVAGGVCRPRSEAPCILCMYFEVLRNFYFSSLRRSRDCNQRVRALLGTKTTTTTNSNGDVETGCMAPWILLGSCRGVL